MSTTYGYGITTTAPGVDAKLYVVTLGVHRRDGGALSAKEVAAIEAALAPLAIDDAAGKPAKKKTTAKASAAPRKAAAGKPKSTRPGPAKASSKPARKASKTTTRKAARRPAEG